MYVVNKVYASIIILIIIAVFAYAPPMFLVNALGPMRIAHIANNIVNVNVNNTGAGPVKNPDMPIKIANAKPALDGRDNIQFVIFAYHDVCATIVGFFTAFVGRKYPGIHVIEKPNGIDKIIFHIGIFISIARQNLAQNPHRATPAMYNDTKTNKMAIIIDNITPVWDCISENNQNRIGMM